MWVFVLYLILYGISRPKSYQIAFIAYLSLFVFHIYRYVLEDTLGVRVVCLLLILLVVIVFGKTNLEKYRKFDLGICVFLQLITAGELLIMYARYTSGLLDAQAMSLAMQICGAGFGLGTSFFACRRWISFGEPARVSERILRFIIGFLSCLLIRQLLLVYLDSSMWGRLAETFMVVCYAVGIYPAIYGGLRKIIAHNV